MLHVAIGAIVGALAVMWAWVPSITALATDDVAPEDYEPYNTFGHVLVALLLSALLPVVAWTGYATALRCGRSRWRAVVWSQALCATIAVLALGGIALANSN